MPEINIGTLLDNPHLCYNKDMDKLAKKALVKGAKAIVTNTDYGYYVEVGGFNRKFGKFKFDKSKNLLSKMVIEKDFYPLELAIYEVSKKRIYKKRAKKLIE